MRAVVVWSGEGGLVEGGVYLETPVEGAVWSARIDVVDRRLRILVNAGQLLSGVS